MLRQRPRTRALAALRCSLSVGTRLGLLPRRGATRSTCCGRLLARARSANARVPGISAGP